MDLSNLLDAALIATAISVLVTGLTQATKLVTPVKDQAFLPVVPLVWGVIIALLAATDYAIGTRVLGGLICGLMSMGLYSGTKTALGK